MRKIIFSIIATLAIIGCSNEEKENETTKDLTDYDNGKVLSLDSIHYYSFKTNYTDNSYILRKKRRDDKSIVWETNVIKPDPLIIDLGYGNKQEVTFNQFYGIRFEASSLLFLIWLATNDWQYPCIKISLYSSNGKFIKHIDINSQRQFIFFVRWKDEKVILTNKASSIINSPNSIYLIIDKNGNIIESKEDVDLVPSDNPIIISDRKYISYSDNTVYICDLDKGTSTIELEDFISDKYPEETNKPKVEIKKIVANNHIATVNIQITLYTGEKKNSVIKINTDTQEITEYIPNLNQILG